jgi:hypothetical protein
MIALFTLIFMGAAYGLQQKQLRGTVACNCCTLDQDHNHPSLSPPYLSGEAAANNGNVNGLAACGAGWDSIDGGCYMVTPQTMPWIDAELFCESAHGQLASFSSSANFEAVFNYYHDLGWISDDTWIGMYDITSEGTFQWTDGSSSTFTNWAANQPDDATGGFNCVETYGDGTWNDQDCSAGFTGICKYAATVTPLEFGTNHHRISLAQEDHQL